MNFNDNPEELKREEQAVLDNLIGRMDNVLCSLDAKMQEYVAEARDANISINPDLYLSQILAQKGIRDTSENRKKLLQARDELYHTRLLLHYEYEGQEGINEVKVGLHSCSHGGKTMLLLGLCHYAGIIFSTMLPWNLRASYQASSVRHIIRTIHCL